MLNRSVVNKIRYVLEDILSPFIRDSRLFYCLMYLMYRKKTTYLTQFRVRLPYLSKEEYGRYYQSFDSVMSDTDLNKKCIDRILVETLGDRIIDVGSGRGYLANLIRQKTGKETVGCDFQIDEEIRKRYPDVQFISGDIEDLPIKDKEFDTVICTHTLEHIVNFQGALNELRRICRKKLILVVPKEREYRYSFNLHVHFFPYLHSFLNRLHPLPKKHLCELLDGDIFYYELLEE